MGIALAQEARRLGAKVTLVLGPVDPSQAASLEDSRIEVIPVVSAREMEEAVQKHLSATRVFIGAAAVSDYRPANPFREKIKKEAKGLDLKLVRNPDIITHIARSGPNRPELVVGFALETNDMMRHAQEKLRAKGLDWIVANRESNIGAKMGEVTLFSRWGDQVPLGMMSKTMLAYRIWEALLRKAAR